MTTTYLINQLRRRLFSVRAEISRMEAEHENADQYRQLSNSGALTALAVEQAFLVILLERINGEGLVAPAQVDEHAWLTDLLSEVGKESNP